MKLIKLSCSEPSFRTIEFNSSGLSIILGTKSESSTNSSTNGVGKTQALRLVHFCLGAKSTGLIAETLKHAVPTWKFKLDFSINNTVYSICRSGDSKYLTLDEKDISYKALLEWLNSNGVFPNINNHKNISFRSLFKRFARVEREDSLDPLKLSSEQGIVPLINNAYLLNLDLTLIERKSSLKKKIEANNVLLKSLKQDSYLIDALKSTDNPVKRKSELEDEIDSLEKSLERFSIADDYHEIENETNQLTSKIQDTQLQISSLQFKVENINKSLKQNPDISSEQLLRLYKGVEQIFRPESLAHFETVQAFHNDLTINRINRLTKEKIEIQSKILALEKSLLDLSKLRDSNLLLLKNKHALDEYLALASKLTHYKEELSHIEKFLTFADEIKLQNIELKKQILDVISSSLEYQNTEPLKNISNKYQEITKRIYPNLHSGIYLESNESDKNMLTYEITVELPTDSSEGVADVKVLAYDWAVFNNGFHNLQILWHDNRLFADIDPEELAKWFETVLHDLSKSNDKQYILSININNFEDMQKYLSPKVRKQINKSIVITLLGDNPANKLLGRNFDKQRKT
ncbi:DUF2326 domain-containing protein [uncultured Psychrobacter sp.]|mgnify:CR=1 FL=1|uniref:DUF2326 domain-containing protein n=2 Tax=uncultured Psychrobacter sp. TaxID=259303 RepID=UPI00261276FB|nr:DUF2326 domain-containing protein [uncultured Psychrobacter sp.]